MEKSVLEKAYLTENNKLFSSGELQLFDTKFFKDQGLTLEEVLELDPAADIFPSSPFDEGTGTKASILFVDRAYTSML